MGRVRLGDPSNRRWLHIRLENPRPRPPKHVCYDEEEIELPHPGLPLSPIPLLKSSATSGPPPFALGAGLGLGAALFLPPSLLFGHDSARGCQT
uniref:Uncharacterized protein n=1 Tax=uncultured marine microorganism HF4000_ANIW137G21 TaxID=455530 RepID=B3T4H7_9ZZZZ|nr:hypothetical protein ALOHA_HF4000ANIW137G21ctg1g14 [uncultured marine microorganism HF4000_ANIW137G21]